VNYETFSHAFCLVSKFIRNCYQNDNFYKYFVKINETIFEKTKRKKLTQSGISLKYYMVQVEMRGMNRTLFFSREKQEFWERLD
jgi:hypothetical protein